MYTLYFVSRIYPDKYKPYFDDTPPEKLLLSELSWGDYPHAHYRERTFTPDGNCELLSDSLVKLTTDEQVHQQVRKLVFAMSEKDFMVVNNTFQGGETDVIDYLRMDDINQDHNDGKVDFGSLNDFLNVGTIHTEYGSTISKKGSDFLGRSMFRFRWHADKDRWDWLPLDLKETPSDKIPQHIDLYGEEAASLFLFSFLLMLRETDPLQKK